MAQGLSVGGLTFGSSTFNDFAGAASDLFSSSLNQQAAEMKAQGLQAEAQGYTMAANLALLNEQYTKTETAVKTAQNEREIYQTISQQRAGVAGGGLAASGSALDLLRSSASQGALSQAIIGEQGLITEAGYQEQHDSYTMMASTLNQQAQEELKLGQEQGLMGDITGGIKIAAGVASLFAV